MNHDNVQRQILALMKSPGYRPCKQHGIMTELGLSTSFRKQVRKVLRNMENQGLIEQTNGNRFALSRTSAPPQQERIVTGILNLHAQGFGFLTVEPEDGAAKPELEELFIPPGATGNARHGDRVTARVLPSKKARQGEDLKEGEIQEIIDRGTTRCVGVLRKTGSNWTLIPDDPRIQGPVRIRDLRGLSPQPRDKAVVELDDMDFATETGVLEEILGRVDDPGVDILAIMRMHGLVSEFEDDVIREADAFKVAVTDKDLAERRDLRKDLIFTIDPVDARDFDDALSIESLPNGHLRVGIHIADVAHFVKPGGAIDREASSRGTSAYLVDRVVTMLPVNLTNDLCSLVPHQDRLAHSVILDINTHGRVKQVDTCRSVIHSKQRLTYEQAQTLLDGGGVEGVEPDVRDAVLALGRLSRKLRRARMRQHALAFNMPEVRCVVDENGEVTGFTQKTATEAYNLVEECMLMANREVGALLAARYGTAIYRIHEEPTQQDFEQMGEDLRQLGLENIPEVSRLSLNDILNKEMSDPLRQAVTITLLKNMNRAIYSAELGEHFGLAFDTYTHFTSPIRRYPDLIAHRMLEALKAHRDNPMTEGDLREICRHCSERERAAEAAEIATIEVKRVAYYHDRLFKGETGPFESTVASVLPRGLLVELKESSQRGLIPFQAMDGDYYEVNETGTRCRGRNTGRIIQLGDPLQVVLTQVDVENRRVDFALAGTTEEEEE